MAHAATNMRGNTAGVAPAPVPGYHLGSQNVPVPGHRMGFYSTPLVWNNGVSTTAPASVPPSYDSLEIGSSIGNGQETDIQFDTHVKREYADSSYHK